MTCADLVNVLVEAGIAHIVVVVVVVVVAEGAVVGIRQELAVEVGSAVVGVGQVGWLRG